MPHGRPPTDTFGIGCESELISPRARAGAPRATSPAPVASRIRTRQGCKGSLCVLLRRCLATRVAVARGLSCVHLLVPNTGFSVSPADSRIPPRPTAQHEHQQRDSATAYQHSTLQLHRQAQSSQHAARAAPRRRATAVGAKGGPVEDSWGEEGHAHRHPQPGGGHGGLAFPSSSLQTAIRGNPERFHYVPTRLPRGDLGYLGLPSPGQRAARLAWGRDL
jgi:hypothetical protein